MIDADYLSLIMDAVEEQLGEIQDYLLEKIANRVYETFLDNNANLFIPATRQEMRLLLNSGMLYEEIQTEIEKRLPSIRGIVHDEFLKSAAEISKQSLETARMIVDVAGINVDIPDLEKVGIVKSAKDLHMTEYEIRQMEAVYRRTMGDITNMTKTTADMSQQAYIDACDTAYLKVKTGVSLQTAIIEAIRDLGKQGVKVVEYSNRTGTREEKIDVAVARAVRTGVNQANGEIVLTRCAEMGVPAVYVSEHLGARVTKADDYTNHSWWQGQVYSVDWTKNAELKDLLDGARLEQPGFEYLAEMRDELSKVKSNYPDLVEHTGFGKMLGLCGINCRHTMSPFYPGINIDRGSQIDKAKNEERYKLDQKQRAMERAIRETKREYSAFKGVKSDDEEFKKEKKRLRDKLQKQSDRYLDFCQKNGLKPRNMSLRESRK